MDNEFIINILAKIFGCSKIRVKNTLRKFSKKLKFKKKSNNDQKRRKKTI